MEPPFEADPAWVDQVEQKMGIKLEDCDHPNGFGIHGCPCGATEHDEDCMCLVCEPEEEYRPGNQVTNPDGDITYCSHDGAPCNRRWHRPTLDSGEYDRDWVEPDEGLPRFMLVEKD